MNLQATLENLEDEDDPMVEWSWAPAYLRAPLIRIAKTSDFRYVLQSVPS